METLKRSEWDLDLRHGQAVEGALANLLLRATVEVKADDASRDTGNFCVEICQDGPDGTKVKSGINATQAEWWAFQYDVDCYLLMPTRQVKELARKYGKDRGNCKTTGDNGNESILVPCWEFIPQVLKRIPRLVK